MTTRRFTVVALFTSLLLAGVVSWFASGNPDGLEHVAESTGFSQTATDHAAAAGPLADYATKGVADERLSTGLAGVMGVAATGLVMGGLLLVLRRRTDTADVREGRPDSEVAGRN